MRELYVIKAFESIESVESIIGIVLGAIVILLTALPPFLKQILKLVTDDKIYKKLDKLIVKIDYIRSISESYKKQLEKRTKKKREKPKS